MDRHSIEAGGSRGSRNVSAVPSEQGADEALLERVDDLLFRDPEWDVQGDRRSGGVGGAAGEVLGRSPRVVDQAAFDEVAKLANVAGPVVANELLQHVLGDRRD